MTDDFTPKAGDVYRAEVPLVDVRALHAGKATARVAGSTVKLEELTDAERAALPKMVAGGFWTRVTNVAPAEEPKPTKAKKDEADA